MRMRLDARLAQPGGGQQPAEAAADHQHVDGIVDRIARLDVGVGVGMQRRELLGPDVEVAAVIARRGAAVALDPVALAQRVDIERGLGRRFGHAHRSLTRKDIG